MLERIKEFFKYAGEKGLRFPLIYDGKVDKPSATLFFTYISFFVCIMSLIFLFIKNDAINPAVFSMILFVICLTFYRLKRLNEVTIDLDDKRIELKSENEKLSSEDESQERK